MRPHGESTTLSFSAGCAAAAVLILIAHEFELNTEVQQVVAGSDVDARYVVLGTLGAGTWRAGMRENISMEQVKDDMADFAAYMQVEITPRHWAPTGSA